MLREYITAVVERITSDKRIRGIRPCSCSLLELSKEFQEDATEIMRQIHKDSEIYEGHVDVNKIPMLILKEKKGS